MICFFKVAKVFFNIQFYLNRKINFKVFFVKYDITHTLPLTLNQSKT